MKNMRDRRGFTIIELLIAMAIGLVLIAAAYSIFISQHKGFEKVERAITATQAARMSLDQVARELRMAGFGVIGREAFTTAKVYQIEFYGDIDADISGVLAVAAAAGDTEIEVDLDDRRDQIESGDYVFINGGGNIEMAQVLQSGTVVDLDGEPDTIYLNTGLTYAYAADTTIIRTIEKVKYEVQFPAGKLLRNDVLISEGLQDLEFHFFMEGDLEMTPDAISGLSQLERAALRKIKLELTTGGQEGIAARAYSNTIELRNMGNRPFKVDTCAPGAPSSLTAVETGNCEQFTVSWTPPTTNACDGSTLTDLAGYQIRYGTASGVYLTPPANVSNETLSSYTVEDTRLENDTTYYATIMAYDSSFNESAYSSEISFTLLDTTAPEPPDDLDALAGVGSVTLSWTTPADVPDLKGYRLYRGTDPGVTLTSEHLVADEEILDEESTSFSDSGLTACTTYYYKLTAIDCANQGEASAEVSGDGAGTAADAPQYGVTNTTPSESPATPPAAVSPFQAIGRDGAVDLAWNNPSDSDFAQVIVRYSNTSHPDSINEGNEVDAYGGTPSQTMNQAHEGLVNNMVYYYSAFSVDQCGNVSEAAQAEATPSATGPEVELVYPVDQTTITNGQLTFQARAYDPDQTGLTEPPSFASDNGKGIASVQFVVMPDPGTTQFPLTEYTTEYCGFGGDTDPCMAGDVSQWCDGTYQVYAVAKDDESSSTASAYTTIIVRNGGVELDETYVPEVTGVYDNEVLFGIKNSSEVDVQLAGITLNWSIPLAVLAEIRIPTETTVFTAGDTIVHSGEYVEFDSYDQPSISANSLKTIKLVFEQLRTTLAQNAAAEDSVITVASPDGFAAGDTIYLDDGSHSESAVIQSIDGYNFNLAAALGNSYGYGAEVRHTAEAADISMHGVELRAVFQYVKTLSGKQCLSDEIAVNLNPAPVLVNPQQDQPADNTNCTTTVGYLQVDNYRDVPAHVEVVDQGGSGISWVKLYYYVDTNSQTVAPESGYASLAMSYNTINGRYEATIPYQSDVRVWVYFQTQDNNVVEDRSPISGAYVFDYIPDTTPPACPLGLVAVKISSSRADLSWNESPEADVRGYNVYRSNKCSQTYKKRYTLVEDADPNTVGVQFSDTNVTSLDTVCARYYVTAVDMQGNESATCSTYYASAGDGCPCP